MDFKSFLKSKWSIPIILAIVALIGVSIAYLKFYHVDIQNEKLKQMGTEYEGLKNQMLKLTNAQRGLLNNISSLQTQMTHGVILDSTPKAQINYRPSKQKIDNQMNQMNQMNKTDQTDQTDQMDQIDDDPVDEEIDTQKSKLPQFREQRSEPLLSSVGLFVLDDVDSHMFNLKEEEERIDRDILRMEQGEDLDDEEEKETKPKKLKLQLKK